MAGSPNAFATAGGTGTRRSSVLTEQDHNARPPKRIRLSDEAVASISTQCAQGDTSLDVDYMILDYAAYQTTNACFASRMPERSNSLAHSLKHNLAISDALLALFKARYPTHQPDPELRLRILLLRLTTLLTQRLTSNPTTPIQSAVEELRAANTERARNWIARSGFRPSSSYGADNIPAQSEALSLHALERNRAHVLHELGIPAEDEDYEDAFYGTASCVSLLDLLPLFMKISAARNSMSGSNVQAQWMKLACEFMLQACLEQYLVIGAEGANAFDEAFAWGYVDEIDEAMAAISGPDGLVNDNGGSEVNAMFEDEDYEVEVDGWKEMRQSYIDELIPVEDMARAGPHGNAFTSHLEAVANAHPPAAFESTLLDFLQAMSKSLPTPVLIQLENGKLDGMTEQETQEFLMECGVGVAKFFDLESERLFNKDAVE